jgi:dipeptidyl aminopeptidase/acylaminoacyl peptidase
VDPARLILIGESAGAQLAATAALQFRLPVTAVVSFYMPSDLEHLARAMAPLHPLTSGLEGSPLWTTLLNRVSELSPLRHVHSEMPPFLLIHGTEDALVPFEQSEIMCRAIRTVGGSCDLLAVKGGAHGMRRWEAAGLTSYKKLLVGWLNAHGTATASLRT